MKTFFIFNTGCIRRGLDSIRIYNYLIRNGWIFTRDIPSANLIIVTTCGAVQEKEEGSLNAIKKIMKRKSKSSRMIITGCLTKINPEKILKLNNFELVPTRSYNNLDKLLNSKIKFKSIPESNTITDNTDILNYVLAYRLFRNSGFWINIFNRYSLSRSFLKFSILLSNIINFIESSVRFTKPQKIVPYHNISIAEGCKGDCAFCAIRFATGALRSKPVDEIVEELKQGLRGGYKYIQLVSEDTGCYGIDIGTTMPALLKNIFEVEGDYKLIIIDFNPRWIVKYWEELLPILINNQDRIREIFIPLQSGSDKVLDLMKRHYTMTEVKPLLLELNKKLPKVRLRTTMMIGFPGETEEDFYKSKDLVKEVNFYEVALNKYEDRPGTASCNYEHKLSQKTINRRTNELAKLN